MRDVANRARAASRALAVATGAQKGEWLQRTAALIRERTAELLEANEVDCATGRKNGLSALCSIDCG